MAWIDIVIIALIVLSAILSLFRGFVTEALALATWLVAFWVAMTFYQDLAVWFSQWVSLPSAQKAVAFAALFVCTWVLGAVVNYLAGKLVAKTGLTGTDRMLGVLFGAARGAVIVTILVLLAGVTLLPQDPWWQDSHLLGYFEELAVWVRNFLPPEFADKINYA
jgi:membrane protein required for colicin V production